MSVIKQDSRNNFLYIVILILSVTIANSPYPTSPMDSYIYGSRFAEALIQLSYQYESKFFEAINKAVDVYGWVDIEYIYYIGSC